MKIEGKEYRTIWFENNVVKIIDQTKLPDIICVKEFCSWKHFLPYQFIIKDLKTVKDAINAIKIMEVRVCTFNWSYRCLWISFSYY